MPSQLRDFEEYQHRVTDLIGKEKTQKLVNDALVLITCGGNDFVNNYYLIPNSVRSRQYKIADYVPMLISEYQKLLMVINGLIIFLLMYMLSTYFEAFILM